MEGGQAQHGGAYKAEEERERGNDAEERQYRGMNIKQVEIRQEGGEEKRRGSGRVENCIRD